METFAGRLRIEMDSRPEINQADIARAAGVSTQAVSGWLSGKYSVTEERARKVAAFLGCSWLWLMHGEQPSSAENDDTRFNSLPAPMRDWLDRQARMVAQFEKAHPLLSSFVFSGDEQEHVDPTLRDLIDSLDIKAQQSSVSGSLLIDRAGLVMGCDDVSFRIIKKASDAVGWHRLPGSITALRGHSLKAVLPEHLGSKISEAIDDSIASGSEVARVISDEGYVIVVTATNVGSSGIASLLLVDISEEIEFDE